jgi:hypothetical protein
MSKPNPVEVRELVDKVTKEFADRGLVIESGWQAFLVLAMNPEASDLQREEMRKAYYFGAQHLFASIMSILDEGAEPTEKDVARVDLINKELERFVKEVKP